MKGPELFKPVIIEKPGDKIIAQIKTLIREGKLEPGDLLPTERQLAEQFGVSRNYVREAIKQLEAYGILQTKPQSGTTVSSLGVKSLEGFIRTAIGKDQEFSDLMDVRRLLEGHSARQAAERATPEQIAAVLKAHETFLEAAERGDGAVAEDLDFHLAIADASGNSVLRTFLGIITPDIITSSRERNSWTKGRLKKTLEEHDAVCSALQAGDPDESERSMRIHMERTRENFERTGK